MTPLEIILTVALVTVVSVGAVVIWIFGQIAGCIRPF